MTWKRVLDVAFALAVVALAVTAAAASRGLVTGRAKQTGPIARTGRPIERASRFAAGGEQLGSPNPRLVLVEFSDFQCPFCRELATTLGEIRRRYPTVAVVYHHYPLTNVHPHAFDAAAASECAALQHHFGDYHDALFRMQSEIGVMPWLAFGDLDSASFSRCMSSGTGSRRVGTDTLLGHELNLRGTPALLVGNRLFGGAVPLPVLDSMVRAELGTEKE